MNRIKLINNYVERLTQGKIKQLEEVEDGLHKIEFRAGTAKVKVQVFLQKDLISITSTLFEYSQIKNNQRRIELCEELLKLNGSTETMSAKFGITENNFVEVLVVRKDLKDLDYSEFLSALKNVCTIADKIGGEITARYILGEGGDMDITPLDNK